MSNTAITSIQEPTPPPKSTGAGVTATGALANRARLRLQRFFGVLTVGIPATGFVVALFLALTRGIGWLELSLFAGMYFATAFGVEGGMHRFFSHRSFQAGRWTTIAIGVLGSMAGQGPILFWAAIHRAHHAFADREGDPHSPRPHGSGLINRLRGVWHAHVGWLFTLDQTDWTRYIPDLLRNRDIVRLNFYYPLLLIAGLALPTAIGGLVTGTWTGAGLGFLWGGLVRMFALDHVTWAVNSLGHLFGRRPYAVKDTSGNVAWLAIPSIGGSWHNNHHAFPASARNDHRPWQIDIAGNIIELLALLGLAWKVHRVSDTQLKLRNSVEEQ